MDINSFLDTPIQPNAIYKYQMLIYGNYTYQENLEADSQTVVLKNVINYLDKKFNNQIHYTILVPKHIKSFDKPNIKQLIYTFPVNINQMRSHYDSIKFLEAVDYKKNDFDIIYCHVPEHANNINNNIFNSTHFEIPMIGYSHWFELPENCSYARKYFNNSMLGILDMKELGVNSEWLKAKVIKQAKRYFNDSVIKKLETKIQPHYLGVDSVLDRQHVEQKSVIFNHRHAQYTGWTWFIESVNKIWDTRKDFKVYTTLADAGQPWSIYMELPSRKEYLNFLQQMKFGIGCFQKYSAWSISVTDGLSVNTPYLLPNKLCYPEMLADNQYPYLYNSQDEFIQKFNNMLDADELYDTSHIAKNMLWEQRIDKWFNGWKTVFEFPNVSVLPEGSMVTSVLDIIKSHKYITKKDLFNELRWGVHIKWSRCRNYLRNHPNIEFHYNAYEWRD